MTQQIDKYTFDCRPSGREIIVQTQLGMTTARNIAMAEVNDDQLKPNFRLTLIKHEITMFDEVENAID